MIDLRLSFSAWLWLFAISVVVGCGANPEPPPQTAAPPPPTIPTVTESPDALRAQMKVMDRLSPEFDDLRFRLLIKLDEKRREHGVEGFHDSEIQHSTAQHAEVDPETRQLAWPALTCFNPHCLGRGRGDGPYLFCYPMPNYSLGPDGKLQDSGIGSVDFSRPAVCPACGQRDFVQVYELPETVARRKQLMEEVERVRRAHRAARKEGKPLPEGLRPPTEIMTEMAELPKLFLVPEPGKVSDFGGVTAPSHSVSTPTPNQQ